MSSKGILLLSVDPTGRVYLGNCQVSAEGNYYDKWGESLLTPYDLSDDKDGKYYDIAKDLMCRWEIPDEEE